MHCMISVCTWEAECKQAARADKNGLQVILIVLVFFVQICWMFGALPKDPGYLHGNQSTINKQFETTISQVS